MKHQKMENGQSILPPDRISNAPNNVVETILMCLPTRDAVRTCILSRKWRHVWARHPQLVFNETLWKSVAKENSARITLMKIFCQFLMRHDGPINKFTLSNPELVSCPEIDNLIFLLGRNHLEDFTLEMWKDCYLLPCSFFSCQKLRHLRLRSCSISSTLAFDGFSMLITLKLFEVVIQADTLAKLISGSPLLGVLELTISSNIDICIDSPNLRTFAFKGKTKSIMFERAPLLASLTIEPDEEVECDILKFFQCSVNLESLGLNYNVTQFENIYRSNSEVTTAYFEREDHSNILMGQLKEVKLDGVTATKPELEFIRLLLAQSSGLKNIQIQLQYGVGNGFEILKQVTKFPRLSKEAEIIFA